MQIIFNIFCCSKLYKNAYRYVDKFIHPMSSQSRMIKHGFLEWLFIGIGC